jgi:ribosomal protein S18 acetylase RimI-like enzyme
MLMQPMTESEFDAFIGQSVAGYARDLERTYGYAPSGALECAFSNLDALLPNGQHTEDHCFFNLCSDTGDIVGELWLEVRLQPGEPATLFICDLEIRSQFQRQGFGQRALEATERWALARGIRRLELNVFADNEAALALYKSAAFVPCEITMGKQLG